MYMLTTIFRRLDGGFSMLNSLWLHTAYPRNEFPKLEEDISCDVCIIGGGLRVELQMPISLQKRGKMSSFLKKTLFCQAQLAIQREN